MASWIVLAGVCTAAAAGWLGVRPFGEASNSAVVAAAAELGAADATQPGVRNRAAWQPSPVPAESNGAAGAVAQPVAQSQSSAPSTRRLDAWQPSPVPSQASQQTVPALPQVSGAPALGGAAVGYGAVAAPGTLPAEGLATTESDTVGTIESLAPPTLGPGVIPFEQLLTTDKLEAAFGGEGQFPEARGTWRYITFHSRALGREAMYLAWLPPDYAATNRNYPTLYLLHGVGGLEGFGAEEWLGYGLTEDLDRMYALGLIQPMIVILPSGDQGFWMNHADGGTRWADFVATDLVKHVDMTFRTDARRERRAIGGLSMGGHGALQLALNHPDTFSIAGAHSPTLRPFEETPEFFGDQKWFAKYDPLSLVKSGNAAQRVKVWIDVGHEDKWRQSADALRKALEAKKAVPTYRVFEGEHEGWYWKFYLPEYLHFYSSALYATAKTPQGAPSVVVNPLGPVAAVSSLS
jgi:enterochelin esterase-like enzyme